MRWLILEKRDKDKLEYTEQNNNNEFAVINNETEASKISENNNTTVN